MLEFISLHFHSLHITHSNKSVYLHCTNLHVIINALLFENNKKNVSPSLVSFIQFPIQIV